MTNKSIIADAVCGSSTRDVIHDAHRHINAEMHRRAKDASTTDDYIALGQVAEACVLIGKAARIMKAVGEEKV